MTSQTTINGLLGGAVSAGTLSSQSSMLIGNLGPMVIAGANGMDAEDIEATDVTLVTLLIDASSSIQSSGLEQAVRDGYNEMLEAFAGSREHDSILVSAWKFDDKSHLLHSYVPVKDATRLDRKNYRGQGTTRLYDTWCDALLANVAYAQKLRDSGTPVRSLAVVITDGADVGSKRRVTECKKLTQDLLASEQFVLAFVGVGDERFFRGIADAMGVPDGSIEVQTNATASGLRRVFQMVSRSAIRASQGQIQAGPQAGFFRP
ncbi:MAG: vWA domain-containing protein [Deltaproteobacteria bacterium]